MCHPRRHCEFHLSRQISSLEHTAEQRGWFREHRIRRPPGVSSAKQANHWIAFTMAFVEMALHFKPDRFASYVQSNPLMSDLSFTDFETKLLQCARKLGFYAQLDPRLRQTDYPRSLHITLMDADTLDWLRQYDWDYHFSECN